MESLKTFLTTQQNTYKQQNTYDIGICSDYSSNISNFNMEEDKFYNLIRNYRNYKLNYSQGKFYQDLNSICTTSCNRNNDIYQYMLLDRKNMEYNGQKILVSNKKYSNVNQFVNKKKYVLEENYEVLTVHVNDNLKIIFEIIGDSHQMKIQLSLENGIPNTYFEEYLNEVDKIINYVASC